MNIERFTRLADAYGGDLARWPESERSAAQAWAETHAEAHVVLAEARRLDADLAAYAPAAPSADVQRRIVTRILAERRSPRRLVGWLAALAGAGAIGAGATAGAAIVTVAPAAQPTSHASSALYEQSSFGDFGSADDPDQHPTGA